ncbi:MAG: hypothetical protein US49_C0005G0070 [candidate division TM6 bacterium GW2011_GWF2_37_49]|nr:MAG: hypothetical protein US49_C0005G0070 [candidate division TM6 bacterium GW2011_GWF2_37_49]
MKNNLKFLLATLTISFFGLNAVNIKDAEKRGLFSFWEDNTKEAPKPEKEAPKQVSAPAEDISAIIENLDALSESGLRCMNCCPPKRIKVCEVCAKRIYTMCLFAHVAKIKNLCVKKEKVEKIWAYVVNTCHLCAKNAFIKHLWADKAFIECAKIEKLCSECADIEHLYSDKAKIEKLWTDKTYTDTLCAKYAKIKKLQTDDVCTKYKAHVEQFGPNIGYVLDQDIKFNTVLDDPNGSIDNTGAGTHYIVPKSGYYVFTLETDASNLRGPTTIVGQPVLHSHIDVNGVDQIHADVAMLSFANNVYTNLSGLLHLNKGDYVACGETALILDPVSGLMPYVGGMLDFNNPIPPIPGHPAKTYFIIHYLSSDCKEDCECECGPCEEHHCDHHCFDMPDCDHHCDDDCDVICPDGHSDCHDDCDDHHECCDNDGDHWHGHHGHDDAPHIVISYEHGHEHCDHSHGHCYKSTNESLSTSNTPKKEDFIDTNSDDMNWNFEF